MAAINDITGAEIKSKSFSKQGRDNWDKIFAKKTAYEWLESESFKLLDPDGWRQDDGVTLDTPISYAEFSKRINLSTVMGVIPNEV